MKKYDVIGIRSPLLDFIVEVDENVLAEMDLRKGEMHLIDEEKSKEILKRLEKHEVKMKRFLEFLGLMKENHVPRLRAGDPHELMHTLELKNMMDMAEVHVKSSLIRTESRLIPAHYRVDYPEQDDENWGNKTVVVRRENGDMTFNIESQDWTHEW